MGGFDPTDSAVQQAVPGDLSELQKLLDKANIYSIEISGLPGWKNVPYAYKNIEKNLLAGEVFIIRGNDGKITTTITLSEDTDEWGDKSHDGRALYFTKFMKDPIKAKQEEATKLLKFAVDEAERRGKSLLRCDVVADQPGIQTYYKNIGFYEQGRFTHESSDREGILLEICIR